MYNELCNSALYVSTSYSEVTLQLLVPTIEVELSYSFVPQVALQKDKLVSKLGVTIILVRPELHVIGLIDKMNKSIENNLF
ncbi:MAG: hypothetical protein ACFFCQ_18720 [Promethearchaeota archaeon]